MTAIAMPSQHHVDQAREELERWQFKLGKVEARAILSSSQAKADEMELRAVREKVDVARASYTAMVDRFTQHDRIQEATDAIRAKLQAPAAEPKRGPLFPGPAPINGAGEADPGEAELDELGDVR
jgi:hypothetical protein